MSPFALLIALLAGCGTDPVQQDVTAYNDAMRPLLAKNLVLAQGFLDVASKVKKGDTDAAKIAERLATEISPAADQLRVEAEQIEPVTPQLGEAHTLLVRAWTERAASYHAMSDAWAQNDPTAFDAARKRNLQSKLDEEKFFQTVNTISQPYGVVLDQYP
ncbi:MAG: hypothetical protein Q8P41_30720 [Pseudomonadota bacterium]|nr:hypothetical protein [Pseudomonadota bacterium]